MLIEACEINRHNSKSKWREKIVVRAESRATPRTVDAAAQANSAMTHPSRDPPLLRDF